MIICSVCGNCEMYHTFLPSFIMHREFCIPALIQKRCDRSCEPHFLFSKTEVKFCLLEVAHKICIFELNQIRKYVRTISSRMSPKELINFNMGLLYGFDFCHYSRGYENLSFKMFSQGMSKGTVSKTDIRLEVCLFLVNATVILPIGCS